MIDNSLKWKRKYLVLSDICEDLAFQYLTAIEGEEKKDKKRQRDRETESERNRFYRMLQYMYLDVK